ncbi:hypothetical protein EV1_028204 [Malus domestica]
MVSSLHRARNSIPKIPKIFPPNPQILTPNSPPIQSHQNPCPQPPHAQNPSRVLQNSSFSTQSSKFPEYEMPSITWGVVQGRKEKLVSRVMQYPFVLGMRIGTVIKPFVDYLVSLGLPKKILARMLEKRTYLLGYDLEETVKPNVDCLVSVGIRREALASVVAQYPQILRLPLKAKTSSQQYLFSLKLKMDPEGFARVIEKMPQIVSLHQHLTMKPVEFLLGRGIASEDVAKSLRRL